MKIAYISLKATFWPRSKGSFLKGSDVSNFQVNPLVDHFKSNLTDYSSLAITTLYNFVLYQDNLSFE